MTDKDTSHSGFHGIGKLGLLGVAFVCLKLTHVIGWSWWWVTAPFWGGWALLILIVGVIVLLAACSR